MSFSLPASPTTGQTYTIGNELFQWDGVKWICIGSSQKYLFNSGGNLNGALIATGPPTTALQTSTRQYAESYTPFRNKLINGQFKVNQRYGTNSTQIVSNINYGSDHWQYQTNGLPVGKVTGGMGVAAATPNPANTCFCHSFTTTTATGTSIGVSDYSLIEQPIEGIETADWQWGSTNATSCMLSFWAKSNLTGYWGGSLRNLACTRSYGFNYNITTPNVWQYFSISIPGDTGGTWPSGIGVCGIQLFFAYICGSTFSQPTATLGTWQGTNYVSTMNVTNTPLSSTSNYLSITSIQLEQGTISSPFELVPYEIDYGRCLRFYTQTWEEGGLITEWGGFNIWSAPWASSTSWNFERFTSIMAHDPTIIVYSPSTGHSGVVSVNGTDYAVTTTVGESGFYYALNSPSGVAAGIWIGASYSAQAELS